MKLGATLDVYRRTGDGELGDLVGRARLVQSDLAQALPPLDRALAGTTDKSVSFAVRPHGDRTVRPTDARDFYVGRVSPAEAATIVEQECSGLPLDFEADELVFFGLTTTLATMAPKMMAEQASLCRIVCLWYCADC